MAPRFIVFAAGRARPEGREALGPLLARAASEHRMYPVFEADTCMVLATAETPVLPIADGAGVVIGHLFHREGAAARVHAGDEVLAAAARRSKGLSLLTQAWGGYVAVVADDIGGETAVLRDPSGVMPCFLAAWRGGQVFFSDLEPALSLGLVRASPSPRQLAHHLVFGHLRTAGTGLEDIGEVLAGAQTLVGPSESRHLCGWSPWTYAARSAQLADRDAAVAALRAETERCVRAWASTAQSILLELSGGLDSSIVAACLRDRAETVSCVTLVTPDPGADERRYAALAAGSIGRALIALPLRADAVDLTQPPQIALPRPGLGALQTAVDQVLLPEGRRLGADSFFGGGGGDNVFCYLGTAAPAVDCFQVKGLGPDLLRAFEDLSQVHGCTTWRAAWLTLKKTLRGPRPGWRRDLRFINPDAAPDAHQPHPWLERPADALQGKIEHVQALMTIQTAPDGKARPLYAPVRHPLLSQPLAELCLRIPSWMWISGGQNRSVARDAFKDVLPEAVGRRASKGEFATFCGAIYARNRTVLADHLLGGWLDQAGLLDHDSLKTYLAAPGPPRDADFFRVLEIAGVETWARSWASRRVGA